MSDFLPAHIKLSLAVEEMKMMLQGGFLILSPSITQGQIDNDIKGLMANLIFEVHCRIHGNAD